MCEPLDNSQREETPCFQHRPLSLTLNQFRLIRITSDGPNGSVLCSVQHFDRANKDAYESYTALSYTWGKREAEDPVYMQFIGADEEAMPAPLTVTQNLAIILRHITDTSRSEPTERRWKGWWWIDALCIIQAKDNPEKDRQIRFMPATYSDAGEVYAWIGSSTMRTDEAMRHIKERTRGSQLNTAEWARACAETWRHFLKLADSVGEVFGRPYWRRLWIIQELSMSSKNTTVACGHHELSLKALRRYAAEVVRMGSEEIVTQSIERTYSLIRRTRDVIDLATTYHRQASGMNLARLIYSTSGSVCGMDKKDYIRALLGLVRCGQGLHIDASQHRCPCSIIMAAMQAMIRDLHPQSFHTRCFKTRYQEKIRIVGSFVATTSNHTETYCDAYEEALSTCREIAFLMCIDRNCECNYCLSQTT